MIPRMNRHARRPPYEVTPPMAADTTPQSAMEQQMYRPGLLTFAMIIFDGTCMRTGRCQDHVFEVRRLRQILLYPQNKMLTHV